jgi:hypothetical protein
MASCSEKKSYSGRFDVPIDVSNIKKMIEGDSPDLLTIKIDYTKILPYSIFHKFSYIKLDTNPDYIIGEITNIVFYLDRIYILDRGQTHNLYAFDLQGKFLSKIRAIGDGPLELKLGRDFDILHTTNEIVVYDGPHNKFIYYDLQLEPLREIKVGMFIDFFRFLNDSTKLVDVSTSENFHEDLIMNHNLIFLNNKNQPIILDSTNANNFRKINFLPRITLQKNSTNRITWSPPFKNAIYSISHTGKIIKEIELNLGKKEIPKEYYNKEFHEINKFSFERTRYLYKGDYSENETHRYLNIYTSRNSKQIAVFVNKESNTFIQGLLNGEEIDRNTITDPFLSTPLAGTGAKFVSILEASPLATSQKDIIAFYPKLNPQLKEIIQRTKSGDNPILQLYSVDF